MLLLALQVRCQKKKLPRQSLLYTGIKNGLILFRPTFKRHVDGIFPANPEEGLVKNKMETLIYYACKSPEKLDRIGEYLEAKISHHVYRGRKGQATIGMEAMDGLIKSCHVNTINLFVESFLKTVQKLLESPDPQLQTTAAASFSAFSQIKEDTPNPHRTYDFFIERFSAMCHAEHQDQLVRDEVRLSGLQGLNGVIRKTVNEDLAENIWEARHMDKIVPSLLYNVDAAQFGASGERETPDLMVSASADGDGSPCRLADQILRELVSCATFSSIKAILRPVLQFMKDHKRWDEPGLVNAAHTFEAIMYSVQTDLSYIVIDRLMAHLDSPKNNVLQKASIAIVLSKIIGIGVSNSTVGPAVLEIINELLKHLKKSAESKKHYDQSSGAPLQQLQHALLDALREYANKMPDFQKIEIMTFILNKVPPGAESHELQLILMKALYCVAQTHTPTLFSTTLSPQLLNTLLKLLQAPDQDVRLLVLQTFQILVDRHNNREKLNSLILEPATLDLEGYPNRQFSRSDQMFAQKSLYQIFSHFRRVLEEQSNSVEFIEAVYTTCALLHVRPAKKCTFGIIFRLFSFILNLLNEMKKWNTLVGGDIGHGRGGRLLAGVVRQRAANCRGQPQLEHGEQIRPALRCSLLSHLVGHHGKQLRPRLLRGRCGQLSCREGAPHAAPFERAVSPGSGPQHTRGGHPN